MQTPPPNAVLQPDGDRPEYIHVYPVHDVREHICLGFTCWCGPKADTREPLVVIHKRMTH